MRVATYCTTCQNIKYINRTYYQIKNAKPVYDICYRCMDKTKHCLLIKDKYGKCEHCELPFEVHDEHICEDKGNKNDKERMYRDNIKLWWNCIRRK